jgi:metal-responsive CopG/Arc/MetJ family transcriptional regulator
MGTTVHVRFPPDLLTRLDALIAERNKDSSGPRWTRTDVVRVACEEYLERAAGAVAGNKACLQGTRRRG